MSQILEQLNAEQERLEQEQMQSQLKNCCNELKLEMLQMKKELQDDLMFATLQNNLLRMKDMHDFIYSNPTLKGDMKELTWQRYVEIYKNNHEDELPLKLDHDGDLNTEEITFGQLIDLMVDDF
jgi:hypothetical protein